MGMNSRCEDGTEGEGEKVVIPCQWAAGVAGEDGVRKGGWEVGY